MLVEIWILVKILLVLFEVSKYMCMCIGLGRLILYFKYIFVMFNVNCVY